jgi:hypothetical protein
MQGLVVDVGAGRLRVIAHVVLDLCHHVLGLDAFGFGHGHLRGEERIFAKGVEGTLKLEIAGDVHERLEGNVDAERTLFAADDLAVFLDGLHVEGGCHAHGGRLSVGGVACEHSGRPVGKAQARNPEPRNASEVAGLSLIDLRVLMCAVDQGEFFSERHLAEQLVNAGIARNHRYCLCLQCGSGREQ